MLRTARGSSRARCRGAYAVRPSNVPVGEHQALPEFGFFRQPPPRRMIELTPGVSGRERRHFLWPRSPDLRYAWQEKGISEAEHDQLPVRLMPRMCLQPNLLRPVRSPGTTPALPTR